ncbi:hypothetical protein [Listeria booriae]|uniref:hypothetical protein n=1 Tax=Listeria booriae TaxID=1552123 RepID=UPI0016268CA7|nr:hypothetical protein [Listeria booriae]MBC2386369.1 hypothetical protein [Listeria booriae]
MKKIALLLSLLLVTSVVMFGCGGEDAKADYTTKAAEKALNDGKDLEGKTVEVTVDKLVPDGSLGYTIQTGEHLNFVSSTDPKVKEKDTFVAKVKKVENVLGSFVISYDKQ